MGLAPDPQVPEKGDYAYETKVGTGTPGRKGSLRFEEGLATDTDVPSDFQRGMMEATRPAPGSQNHVDPETQFKHADETQRERAHVGSAAWIESPAQLGEFASAAMRDYDRPTYDEVQRSGGRYMRPSPVITD